MRQTGYLLGRLANCIPSSLSRSIDGVLAGSDGEVGCHATWKATIASCCKGHEREKVATSFLLLRAVLLGCKSVRSLLSEQKDRADSLDLLGDRVVLRLDVRARQRSKYCAIPSHGLGRERGSAYRNQRTRPNRRWLLVDWFATGSVPL